MTIKLSATRLDMGTARVDNAAIKSASQSVNALGSVSGATTINLALGSVITATIAGATTFSVTNVPSSTQYNSFTLILTNGGRYAVTWMSGTIWLSGAGQFGSAPTLTAIGGTDVLTFFTTDNGASWRGVLAMANAAGGGKLFAWGSPGGVGALAQGVASGNASSPVQIAGTWFAVTGGRYHGLGIRSDGTLWSWGANNNGQLGVGHATDVFSPVQLAGTWTKIAAGQYHSIGVRADNSLWVWGYNTSGALGLGDTVKRSSPVQVTGNWSNVFAGNARSFFINTSGDLFATGSNGTFGHLGLGDTVGRSSPVQVAGTWSTGAGGVHGTLGVRTNGTLWGIGGYNVLGFLGLGDTVNRSSPVQVGAGTSWSAAFSHPNSHNAAALRSDGALFAMGFGNNGALGLGNSVDRSSPTQVTGTWSAVGSGQYHHVGVQTNGSLFSWGYNGTGNLGLGDTVTRSSPVQVAGVWSGAAGARHTSFGTKL